MTSNTWTFERIEALRALWKTGKTVVMIAGELGVSTGAVIGKVHRLGLPVRKGETRRDPKAPRQGKSGAKPGTRPYIRKRVIRPMISPSASPVVRQEVSIPSPFRGS